ncbi:hypothetical protein A9Q99_13895 [Gammaproteobacteria bacterium 45_16_T64]|nr:hypothetical protein A9Q99_13895 [Gammaproteobacteria bacterium 45_16_T64]
MESLPYVLPIVMLLFAAGTAVAVKMLSLKSIVGGIVVGILSLFMIGISIWMMLVSSGFENKLAAKDVQLAEMNDWKYHHMDEMSLVIGQQRIPSDEDVALVKKLKGYGWLTSHRALALLQEAHMALEVMRSENPNTRTRYLIKGVPEAADRKLVELGLRNIGFRIVPYKEQEVVPPNANALYYGQNVDLESVKMAALTLIQAGIEVKSIKPFPKPTRGNIRAIKIDWSKYFDTRQPMSITSIVESKGFN